MTAIATAAAGNWSLPATWIGGVVPGVGDTVTIDHAVTVDANTIVGSSPATGGTAAILANAALTLAAGVTLTVRGDCLIGDAPLTLEAGAVMEGDSPAAVTYRLTAATNHNQFSSRIVCNGTQANPCVIRRSAAAVAAGGGFWISTGGFEPASNVQATWTHFEDLVNASAPFHGIDFSNLSATPATWYDDCTFARCGPVALPIGIQPSGSVRFRRTKFVNGLSFEDLNLPTSGAQSGGERILDHCSFPLGLFTIGSDILLTECRIGSLGNPQAWAAGSRDNIMLASNALDILLTEAASATRWYVVQQGANPHWVAVQNGISQVYTDMILETPDAVGAGDGFTLQSPSAPQTYTFRRCMMIPNGAGLTPGRLVSGLGNANTTAIVEHCTAIVDALGGVGLGETYAGHVGMLASVKSNLFFTPSGTGYWLTREPGSTVQDLCLPANADFNGTWGVSPGTDGGGVNAADGPPYFSVPGQHQLNGVIVAADPFVDRTRNLATWDASLGGPGTFASAKSNLLALTPGYSVAALLDWVFAGFAVTDATLQNAGHDGVTIGASAFVAGGASGTVALAFVLGVAAQAQAPSAATVSASLVLGVATQAAAPVASVVSMGFALGVTATATAVVAGTVAMPLTLGLLTQASVPVQSTATLPLTLGLTATSAIAVQATAGLPLALGLTATAGGAAISSAIVVAPLGLQVTVAAQAPAQAGATVTLTLGAALVGTALARAQATMIFGLAVAAVATEQTPPTLITATAWTLRTPHLEDVRLLRPTLDAVSFRTP